LNLFELSAKISVDDSNFKKSMENAQKVSKNVATAVEQLQSPLDKVKSGFNAIAHPIETTKANFEKLKNATEAIRHPIETFKNKVADASTALETKRNKLSTLAAGYDSAKKKVADITKEFNKSAKESGTSSQKTQELAKKLNEAEKEAEEAKKELDDYSASVSKAGKNSDSASNGVGNFASKLGKGLATAGKIGVAAVGAAAAGVTALTTAAVNNYAEYEQLVGGVETLFKGSADKVKEYAASAFRTSGMSANEYMSTVTSFSASLLQSLGGDTEAAAEYANQALTDMSDNANKMGTDMSLIQNAYQGFAKANYTMLDNLKLGYGGTQSEMQRLIEDAAKLSDTVDAQDMSFANIVKAINVVQTEMGITGTTAKEAASTIQGSVGMMKSSWTNLVTGIADENANLDVLIANFVDSVGTVAQNIVPKIGVALNGVSKLISDLIPVIVQEIPVLIEENLPILAEAAISIIQALVDGLSQNQKMLMSTAFETITYLATSILSMLPQIVKLGLNLIVSLANGIAQAIPNLIPTIVSVVLEIVNILTNPDTLSNLINASVEIIFALADGLIAAIPSLVDAIPLIVESLISAIMENIGLIIEAGIQVNLAILQGIISAIPQLASAAIQIITFLAQSITNPENVQKIINTAGDLINSLIEGFNNVLDSLVDVGEDVVKQIKKGISDAWDGLKKWFNDIWDSLFGNRSIDVDVAHSSSAESHRIMGTFGRTYDSYYDLTHNGERFLTVAKSNQRNGGSVANTSGVTIIQNIQAVPQTPVELAAATSAYFEQARWAF
jgi:phage-related protein